MLFELYPKHKSTTKHNWNRLGVKFDLLEFEIIYNKYINSEYCELCNKEFLNRRDRCMEHDHETGYFRNICCQKCNHLKADNANQKNNKSGYRGISKQKTADCKQGFMWVFEAYKDRKRIVQKSSVNLNKLIEFATEWKLNNNYNT